jgi:molybdopterin-guanine dinucleotide biosynthesis protein A
VALRSGLLIGNDNMEAAMINDCTAIILAGGDSRRMGRDKATLPFAGTTLMQAVIATMQQLFPATLVSVRQIRPEIYLPQVCDTQADGGPLTGLVTTLSRVATPWAFVVACDMPFISPALVELLGGYRFKPLPTSPCQGRGISFPPDGTTSHSTRLSKDDSQVAGYDKGGSRGVGCQAIIPVVHGQLQPLAAFYSTGCIPLLRASLALGNKSLLGALKHLDVCYVDETQMRQTDPQLHSFFDLDTPQDLTIAQSMRQGME